MEKTVTYKDGNDWWESLPEPHKSALEGTIIYDGYYDAILGYTELHGVTVLLYSREKCIEELAAEFSDNSDNPYTDAIEFFDYNVVGGWLGEHTPLILSDEYPMEDMPITQNIRRGFIGYATRCSDMEYAIFEQDSELPQHCSKIHMPVNPYWEPEPFDTIGLKLTRMPKDET